MLNNMERKLVTLRTIKDVIHHPNADKLDIVTVDGWQCVAKRDEFKVGDLCIYFEIDSVLPEWEEFEFMKDRKYRVRTIKLRGELSQGLALPVSLFDNRIDTAYLDRVEDLDLLFEVKLFEPKEASKDSHTWCENQESFPPYVPKTNQERIQNLTNRLDKWKDTPFIVTEKLDGSSMTLIIEEERDLICSRNLAYDLSKEYEDNRFVRFVSNRVYPTIKEWCKSKGYRLAFQGELIGEGVQKNPYKLVGNMWYIFDIYDLNTYVYLSHDKVEEIVTDFKASNEEVQALPVKYVPNLGIHFIQSLPEMLATAEGESVINPNVMREGVVYKTTSTRRVSDINSFKVISNSYLLKHE